jgi:hypothetical protein
MTALAVACFACAAACAIAMQVFDARMQRYRSPAVPASAFRWVPLRWWDPALYAGEGQKYRRRAIRSWWMTVAFFVVGVIAAAFGS